MTKSSVDRKRSKYGEKYSLRFHKRLKTYELSCNDETPHLIAKFVETDGDLAMRLFERLESNYKENEQLKDKYNEQSVQYEGLEEQVERLLDFKDNVFNLINAKIKEYKIERIEKGDKRMTEKQFTCENYGLNCLKCPLWNRYSNYCTKYKIWSETND